MINNGKFLGKYILYIGRGYPRLNPTHFFSLNHECAFHSLRRHGWRVYRGILMISILVASRLSELGQTILLTIMAIDKYIKSPLYGVAVDLWSNIIAIHICMYLIYLSPMLLAWEVKRCASGR